MIINHQLVLGDRPSFKIFKICNCSYFICQLFLIELPNLFALVGNSLNLVPPLESTNLNLRDSPIILPLNYYIGWWVINSYELLTYVYIC